MLLAMRSVSSVKKAAIAIFFACLLPIAVTSGYWTQRPDPHSRCQALLSGVPLYPAKHLSARQLTHEAEFAEDLAIRYADACCGPRSGHFESMEEYGRRRDECMAQFFQVVALAYGTTENEIRASLTRRRPELDAASMISFFIIYVWLANALAFRILRGRNYESLGTKVILLYAALLMGAVFVHAGNIWCDTMEAIRLGNGHGSYRDRVPWDHHAAAEYVVGILVFCGAAVIQRRTAALESSSQRLPTEQV
ncbi:MAG: hypothetical protein DMG96_04105 [Acidobacteria bacterium]|nr:MAG: hypothetical protein DMG96_04105 [Acidobacteriota bacterium]